MLCDQRDVNGRTPDIQPSDNVEYADWLIHAVKDLTQGREGNKKGTENLLGVGLPLPSFSWRPSRLCG